MSAPVEKYLTDVELAVITPKDNSGSWSWKTASKVGLKISTEETKGTKLIIHGVLKAQKKDKKIITGSEISFEDNVFLPEVVRILQGGVVTFDATETSKFKSYAAPLVGDEKVQSEPFDLDVYTANYDPSGEITVYTKISFPNCTGQPIDLEVENDKFFAPKYTIVSAPNKGESPYVLTDVATLPVVSA